MGTGARGGEEASATHLLRHNAVELVQLRVLQQVQVLLYYWFWKGVCYSSSPTKCPVDYSREAHSCSREASLGAERRHALSTQEAASSLQHLGGKYEPLPPLFKYEPMPPPAFHHLLGKWEHECSDGGQTPLSGRIPPVTEKYSRLR